MKNIRLTNLILELKKDKVALFSMLYLVAIIFIAIFVGFLGMDPDSIDVSNMLSPPSNKFWFGTDEMGRDYFARVLYGGRISLVVGILAMATSVIIGVIIGTASGFFGGHIDNFLMRIVDVFSSIPWIIMVTVFALLFKKGLASIIFVIGLFSWMEIARLVRAESLSAREREYVKYAEFIGCTPINIITSHIIPSVFPTIITAATAAVANAIMTESALSFLGLGIQQPMSSWGSLLQSSQQYLQMAPYMAVLPGILIILTIFSFNKMGDILRVFIEPKTAVGDKHE